MILHNMYVLLDLHSHTNDSVLLSWELPRGSVLVELSTGPDQYNVMVMQVKPIIS